MKTCIKCGRELEDNLFVKDCNQCKQCKKEYNKEYYRVNIDKFKECNNEYRKVNADKLKEQHKEYYKANADKRKEYYKANADKIKERDKEYYMVNIDKIKERDKEYYMVNIDKIKERDKKYRKANPEVVRKHSQTRRAKKKQLKATLTVDQWQIVKDHFNNKCAYCGKEKPLAQEHFIPLSKGGEYTHNNIIPACQSCNCSKGNKHFDEWYPTFEHYNKAREIKIKKFLGISDNIQQPKLFV
jgi:5-methylcytosine-specific restriction endonuclease McrA